MENTFRVFHFWNLFISFVVFYWSTLSSGRVHLAKYIRDYIRKDSCVFCNKNTKVSKVETGMVIKIVAADFTANEMPQTVEKTNVAVGSKALCRYSYNLVGRRRRRIAVLFYVMVAWWPGNFVRHLAANGIRNAPRNTLWQCSRLVRLRKPLYLPLLVAYIHRLHLLAYIIRNSRWTGTTTYIYHSYDMTITYTNSTRTVAIFLGFWVEKTKNCFNFRDVNAN